MKKTYIFRRYRDRPRIFTERWVPATWTRNEVELIESNNDDFFTNQQFATDHNIQTYTIKSHKQVLRSKLYVRDPSWNYIIPEFFQENILNFFILNWEENHRNCFIYSTKEWFKQLHNQANNRSLEAPYLTLLNTNINLNDIITRVENINLIWIWFSIDWNPNLKSIKLKWNQSVLESREAQQAISDWWVIKYIEFSHWDTNFTLYDDFTFSFYSDSDFEADILLINELINRYNLLN
jgi:hypothetical protein